MTSVLHLVRLRTTPAPDVPWASGDEALRGEPGSESTLMSSTDWLVRIHANLCLTLSPHGAPPLPPGPITFDDLHTLLSSADRVVTW